MLFFYFKISSNYTYSKTLITTSVNVSLNVLKSSKSYFYKYRKNSNFPLVFYVNVDV